MELLNLRFQDSFYPLYKAVKEKVEGKLMHIFEQVDFMVLLDNNSLNAFLQYEQGNFESLKTNLLQQDRTQLLSLSPKLLRYKKNGLRIFSLNIVINIQLQSYQYEIRIVGNKELRLLKLYSEKLSEFEIETIVNEWGKLVVEEIKKKLNKN